MDTQRVLFKLNKILLSDEFSLEISIMEEKCSSFFKNFEKLKFDKETDKLKGLKIIYDWFKNEYQPKWFKEDFFVLMKELGINKKNCNNLEIQKFFGFIVDLKMFLKNNIELIKDNDILQVLNDGIKNLEEINNL